MSRVGRVGTFVAVAAAGVTLLADEPATPTARLVSAPTLTMPGAVDSNNPVVWDLDEGERRMFVLTSFAGAPSLSIGPALDRLPPAEPVTFDPHPGHGVWLEAVIPDDQGAWFALYHHETPADACGRADRFIPRLGAARSFDRGRTWQDLGFVLEAPPDSYACASTNRFVLGGVGDVTAMLDADGDYLYLFFSQYAREPRHQGVGVARLAWADRDAPVGKVAVWNDGAWLPAVRRPDVESEAPAATPDGWTYAIATVLVPPSRPWHDGGSSADVYWGPAVHWNTHLEQYVMLVNRARDEQFNQDGIYVAFTPTLDKPDSWSQPARIKSGGGWYAQVVGLETDGTDRRAGARARFFQTGRSEYVIEFRK